MDCDTFRACVEKACREYRSKKALSFFRNRVLESVLTYQELDRDANRMANRLLDWGVQKGDRVILCLAKSLAAVVAHLGIQKIGAISVPLNPGFREAELAYLIRDANPALAVSGGGQQPLVRRIAPDLKQLVVDTQAAYGDLDVLTGFADHSPDIRIDPRDPALIIYTSGTTGHPKGAVLTQHNLITDARNITEIWEISESDGVCHALPLFHVHGLCFALHTSLLAGAHVIMLDQFHPAAAVDLLSRQEGESVCSVFMAVPAMYGKMMEHLGSEQRDFSHMRLFTSGSAPLLVSDFDRIREVFGREPVEREGMSETGMNFSNPLRGKRKPGSIGKPLPGLSVRVVDPQSFQDMAPGRTGEFWLKGPAITPGYWQKPEETRKAFHEGWFRTGDLGRVDDEGYYYLTDRIKHIIISGGENISPKEVEQVINQLDNVIESSVVGLSDDRWGEKVVAAVVPKAGSDLAPEDIQRFCKEHLHPWKCPKEVVLVDELPKNTMGKVLKEEVRNLFSP